ncbi:MAG: Rpn family recombination-promoting nuclease/putative transposase [Lachnospiraceae bacterium]|nr:Rpn family recombination-promoting nuclease/putative transposase [Lachnospiraceae bacterium]
MEKAFCSKEFYGVNTRFADLINGIGCDGKQVVKPEDLQELDTQTGIWKMNDFQRGQNSKKAKGRDLLRKTAFGMNFAVVGIENQEEIDYALPLRVLSYDVGEYEKQANVIRKELKTERQGLTPGEYLYGFAKDSHLHPVITFVLYYGEKDWDGPRDLYGMIDFSGIPRELANLVQNSRVHLVEVRKLKNTQVFRTDIRQVFDFIRYSTDRQALKELITRDDAYQAMEEDAYRMVALYAKSKQLLPRMEAYKKGGKVDMCKALEEMIEEGRQEGLEKGIEKGIEKGLQALIETCKEFGASQETTMQKIVDKYKVSAEDANIWMEKYW